MTSITRTSRTIAALAAAAAVALAAPAGAIVPPKDCGIVKLKGKRYNIKSDQLKCPTARKYSLTYLKSHHKPSGYTCNRYSGSKIVFRCVNAHTNPDRTFYAIKR
jgi:hypothetical protein